MKNTVIITILITLAFAAQGQSWAEEGTKWTFNQTRTDGHVVTPQIFVIGDTLLAGYSAKMLMIEDFRDKWLPVLEYEYTRYDSGIVYMWKEGQWCLLYDLNVEVGESYEVTCHEEGLASPGIIVEVIRKGEYVQAPSGEKELYQEIRTDDSRYDASGFVGYTTGNWSRFLPTKRNESPKHGPWRCLEQGNRKLINYTLFQQGEVQKCKIGTSTSESERGRMIIEPNPAAESITILNWQRGMEISLYNLSGKLLLRRNVGEINISELKEGMYFLQAKNSKKALTGKLIKR